jgi:chemotaxis protein MotB
MRLIDPTLEPLSGPAMARARQSDKERHRAAVATPWILLVVAVGAGAFVVWDLQGRERTAQASAARLTDELSLTKERAADGDQQLIAAQGALTKEKQAHDADVSAMKSQLDAAATQAKAASQRAEKADVLADNLEKTVAKTEGELVRSKGRLTLNLVDKVLFPPGEADITPQGEEVLRKVGEIFNEFPDKQIWVIGHTDDVPIATPDFPSNWELSTARALTVVHFLQDQAKVDPRRLGAAGMGPYRPIRGASRAKNRRIEIVLLPKDVELVK